MQDQNIQQTILQGYLRQQLHEAQQQQHLHPHSQPNGGAMTTAVQNMQIPSNDELEEFKAQVRKWIDMDNTLKKLQNAVRERRDIKKQLTEKITAFMARFNIEDLSTRDGKIRFKVAQVKPPMSRKTIQQRLIEMYPRVNSAEELTTRVFTVDERVERATLRRVTVRNRDQVQ